MESLRPCCYEEYCSAKTSWEKEGMRIKWTQPAVPAKSEVSIYEPVTLKLCLECKKPIKLRDVTAWAWTQMFHKDNTEGVYKEIELIYEDKSRQWDEWGVTIYLFSCVVIPTHSQTYILTYNVKFRNKLIWANVFQVDHIIRVTSARLKTEHQFLQKFLEDTLTIRHAQITRNLHLGNYMALTLAKELEFDTAVLLTEDWVDETHYGLWHFSRVFFHLDCPPGAGHVIPRDKLHHVIEWLRDPWVREKKILIGDQDGYGYKGSIMTGYLFANNPHLTFDEAYTYVKSKFPVYCHKGLKATLYDLYPRR